MKENKRLNGFLAKVNIVDRKTGEIIQKNATMKIEDSRSIEQINAELAKFNLPRKFELVEWIA